LSYPKLTIQKAEKLAVILRNSEKPLEEALDENEFVDFVSGDEYPRNLIDNCANSIRDEIKQKITKDGGIPPAEGYLLEARMAGPLHESVSKLGVDMLQDEDFWRYLALFPFRWFLVAREPELHPQDFGGIRKTTIKKQDGTSEIQEGKPIWIYQLLYRTFLWGKIAFEKGNPGQYDRATVIGELGGPSIDIWHSHMIRTQLGQLGNMPHSLIDVLVKQIPKPSEMKDPARETAKLIARLKHNVLLDVYEKKDSDVLVSEKLSDSFVILAKKK
jgi:hypothetical protein